MLQVLHYRSMCVCVRACVCVCLSVCRGGGIVYFVCVCENISHLQDDNTILAVHTQDHILYCIYVHRYYQ